MSAADTFVLDNTTLYDAADALDREADVVLAHAIDDGEVVSILREAAEQLRAAAKAAESGPLRVGTWGWPGVNVVVQGVAEDSELRCQVLRGPEPYQPVCTLPAQHDGPHRWGRAREEAKP